MRIVEPSFEILTDLNGPAILKRIEAAGRTCYKSEEKISEMSAEKFVRMILKRGHETVIEHEWASVRIVCSRGMSHEIVRHRLASYSQESTRYCNYGKDKFGSELSLTPMMDGLTEPQVERRLRFYQLCEELYLQELEEGISPQQARDNLLICLKTEIVMTCNLRQWRHFFNLRTPKAAHPQLRQVTRPMLVEFRKRIPIIFDDIGTVDGN